MKTKLFALFLFSTFAFVACEKEEKESDEFCSNPEAVCEDNTPIDASSCCTNTGCYWTYNEKDYQCDGKDCNDVLDQIVNDACGASTSAKLKSGNSLEKLKAELQAVTDELMKEAIAAAGC
jgi:hypothetical protein